MSEDRNRTTVRRALRAAGVVAASALLLGLLLAVTIDLPLRAVVALAVAAGAFVAAAWLLLSTLLDTIAGEPPDRRRTLWTVAATLVAMLGPFLLLSAFVAPEGAAG